MDDRYRESGVDLQKADQSLVGIQALAAKSFSRHVLGGIGGFAALFELDLSAYPRPVLVSSTDGVGTKVKVTAEARKYDTIGVDLVAMCVNDLLTTGADPLFFLDYIAFASLEIDCLKTLVAGMTEGCRQANMSLVGGETAEMPGLYAPLEYDLAGFVVGVVNKEDLICGRDIARGDLVFALPSSGFHSNGFSLIRQVLFSEYAFSLSAFIDELGETLQNLLLQPTRIYYEDLVRLKKQVYVKGLAHVTGGGVLANLRRILPQGRDVSLSQWEIPKLFQWFQKLGSVRDEEMFRVFNMGLGMLLVVSPEDARALPEEVFCVGAIR